MAKGEFKPIDIGDKAVFDRCFREDPPQVSELTFTNLFIWRHQYHAVWREWRDCLLVILEPPQMHAFGLPPLGTGDKAKALEQLLRDLGEWTPEPTIRRVGEDFVSHFVDRDRYQVTFDRDNCDYVYLTGDLISLSGNRYHAKKNHLNRFKKTYAFEFRSLSEDLVQDFLGMQESWCQIRECFKEPGLLSEEVAVHEALVWFSELRYKGGAIFIDGKAEAFSLGEPLNSDTAVIHIEKANPDIPGLYTAINQLFCEQCWSGMVYVNREQDLGVEGLRKAKESYLPHHLVNKYIVTPE